MNKILFIAALATFTGCGTQSTYQDFASSVMAEMKHEGDLVKAALEGCARGLVIGEKLRGLNSDNDPSGAVKRMMICDRLSNALAGMSLNAKDSVRKAEIRACVLAPMIVGLGPANEEQEKILQSGCAE